MRVNLTWVTIILFIILFFVLGIQGKKVYEEFQNSEDKHMVEGFTSETDDISLTTCPANTKSFVDEEGNTVCCEGDLENGKCLGKIACSIGVSKYPTCGRYYAAILEEKGRDRCPVSMPTYFEDMKSGVRGCVQGKRKQDGSAPLPGMKFCRLYTSKQDDEIKADSCSNQSLLDKTICPNFSPSTQKRILGYVPSAIIQCVASDKICMTDETYDRYMRKSDPNWKTNFIRQDPASKLQVCSVAKRYYVDKTLSFDDLKYATLTGVNRPVEPRIIPAPPKEPVLKKIGGEGQRIYVAPNTMVQYGANGKFVGKRVSGWFVANNQFFGRDPIPGIYKSVFEVL